MENTWILGTFLFFLTTIIFVSKTRNLKTDLKISRDEQNKDFVKYTLDSVKYDEQQKRLANYTLVSIELNNICDEFKSSREAKANNETLQYLLDQLN